MHTRHGEEMLRALSRVPSCRAPPRHLAPALRLRVAGLYSKPSHDDIFDLCAELPNYGVGARLYREAWAEKDFPPAEFHYLITRVNLVRGCDDKHCRMKVPAPHLRSTFSFLVRAEGPGGLGSSHVEGPGRPAADSGEGAHPHRLEMLGFTLRRHVLGAIRLAGSLVPTKAALGCVRRGPLAFAGVRVTRGAVDACMFRLSRVYRIACSSIRSENA